MTGISIGWLTRRRGRKAAVGTAYTGLMTTALAPDFYLAGDVPDTFEARAGMVMVHATVALRRMRSIPGREAGRMAAALNTRVLDGFDAAYREQGVGDSSIARKVRKLAEAYYGLGLALTAALDETAGEARESDVKVVLERNGVTENGRAAGLAAWLCTLADGLEVQQDAEILAGTLDWSVGCKVR
ncbi:MAG: ubiquinol-cytochrome C chaperone family protein [Hyphomonas sp.]|uniref:ubiquinol-cytochrome C chaperone family protein n=1 Tax=Hyphomonas sp. TaxID=87 RepID=UPI0030026CFE